MHGTWRLAGCALWLLPRFLGGNGGCGCYDHHTPHPGPLVASNRLLSSSNAVRAKQVHRGRLSPRETRVQAAFRVSRSRRRLGPTQLCIVCGATFVRKGIANSTFGMEPAPDSRSVADCR